MAGFWRSVFFGLALWTASAGYCLASQPGADALAAHDTGHQVLVMLRLPPEHFRPNAQYSDAYSDGLGRLARRRVAGRLAREHGLALVSDWPMPLLGVDCFVMSVPADRSPAVMATALARDPAVAWSEPMHAFAAQGGVPTYNDPLFRAEPAAREWRLADLHQIATGRDVLVAVIDSRVETGHPDLIGQVQFSEDFVGDHRLAAEEHGTGVAGVIAARANNHVGIVGIAPGARLMALRACWQLSAAPGAQTTTVCDSLSLAKALDFAISHSAQVINLSLSGPPDQLLGKLIDVALARGASVIAAFDRHLPGGGFPASHPGVIAVADEPLERPRPGVYVAPGRDVPTTQPGGRWYLVNGSSYAAAQVSGLVALLRERRQAPRRIPVFYVSPQGGGLDTCATLLRAAGPCDCGCARKVEISAIVR